jgi:hypothetical protein
MCGIINLVIAITETQAILCPKEFVVLRNSGLSTCPLDDRSAMTQSELFIESNSE